MNEQVFISYKAEERKKAEQLRSEIEKAGFSCWMAPLSIPGGSSYAAEIENAIKSCKALVLVFSEAAMKSKWVEKEVDRAINQDKLILPIRTENFELNSAFRYYLTNVQFYEAYQDYDFAVLQLIEQIKNSFEPDMPVRPSETDGSEGAGSEETRHADEPESKNVPAEKLDLDFPKKKGKKSVKKEKPNKVKKTKPETPKSKNVLKKIMISAAALFLLAGMVAVVFGIKYKLQHRAIMIAGEKIYSDNTYLEITDYALTDTDIANINKMKNLRRVTMTNCELSNEDVGKIKAFQADYKEGLYEINLKGNKEFTDLSLLTNVQDLDSFNVSETGINDFSALSDQFVTQTYSSLDFVADDCDLTSFNGLESINPGRRLSIEFSFCNCNIDNAMANSFIQTIQNNEDIILHGVALAENPKLTELSFLNSCTELTELSVSDTGIASLSGLENCIYLEKLVAENCGISSLDGIGNMTVLCSVDLVNNELKDISILKQSSKTMKQLFLGGNQIGNSAFFEKNADALQEMIGLEMLDLSENGISDVSFLEGKENIKWLRLRHNRIRSLDSCLPFLKHLKDLDVSENQLDSFDFSALPNGLKTLDLSNNHMSFGPIEFNDFSADIDYLAIQGNTYTSIALFGGECDFIVLDYVEGVDYSYNYFSSYETIKTVKMLNCPLNKQVAMNELFSDRISYVSAEEYDGYVSDVIWEKRDAYT